MLQSNPKILQCYQMVRAREYQNIIILTNSLKQKTLNKMNKTQHLYLRLAKSLSLLMTNHYGQSYSIYTLIKQQNYFTPQPYVLNIFNILISQLKADKQKDNIIKQTILNLLKSKQNELHRIKFLIMLRDYSSLAKIYFQKFAISSKAEDSNNHLILQLIANTNNKLISKFLEKNYLKLPINANTLYVQLSISKNLEPERIGKLILQNKGMLNAFYLIQFIKYHKMTRLIKDLNQYQQILVSIINDNLTYEYKCFYIQSLTQKVDWKKESFNPKYRIWSYYAELVSRLEQLNVQQKFFKHTLKQLILTILNILFKSNLQDKLIFQQYKHYVQMYCNNFKNTYTFKNQICNFAINQSIKELILNSFNLTDHVHDNIAIQSNKIKLQLLWGKRKINNLVNMSHFISQLEQKYQQYIKIVYPQKIKIEIGQRVCADEFIEIIADLANIQLIQNKFTKSQQTQLRLKVLELLESKVAQSKYNFDFKLKYLKIKSIIKLWDQLYIIDKPLQLFKSMDIKDIMLQSISNIFLKLILTHNIYQKANQILQSAVQNYIQSKKQNIQVILFYQNIGNCLKYNKAYKIFQFQQFIRWIQSSYTKLLVKYCSYQKWKLKNVNNAYYLIQQAYEMMDLELTFNIDFNILISKIKRDNLYWNLLNYYNNVYYTKKLIQINYFEFKIIMNKFGQVQIPDFQKYDSNITIANFNSIRELKTKNQIPAFLYTGEQLFDFFKQSQCFFNFRYQVVNISKIKINDLNQIGKVCDLLVDINGLLNKFPKINFYNYTLYLDCINSFKILQLLCNNLNQNKKKASKQIKNILANLFQIVKQIFQHFCKILLIERQSVLNSLYGQTTNQSLLNNYKYLQNRITFLLKQTNNKIKSYKI